MNLNKTYLHKVFCVQLCFWIKDSHGIRLEYATCEFFAVVYTDFYANTNAHANADSYANPHPYADADPYADPHTDPYAHAHTRFSE